MQLHDVFNQFVVKRTRGGGVFIGSRGETKEDREKIKREKKENEKKRGFGLCWAQFGLQEMMRRK